MSRSLRRKAADERHGAAHAIYGTGHDAAGIAGAFAQRHDALDTGHEPLIPAHAQRRAAAAFHRGHDAAGGKARKLMFKMPEPIFQSRADLLGKKRVQIAQRHASGIAWFERADRL